MFGKKKRLLFSGTVLVLLISGVSVQWIIQMLLDGSSWGLKLATPHQGEWTFCPTLKGFICGFSSIFWLLTNNFPFQFPLPLQLSQIYLRSQTRFWENYPFLKCGFLLFVEKGFLKFNVSAFVTYHGHKNKYFSSFVKKKKKCLLSV